MMEKQLERIANSLEELVAHLKGHDTPVRSTAQPAAAAASNMPSMDPQPAKPVAAKQLKAAKPEAPVATATEPTVQDVTAMLRKFVDKKGEKGHELGKALLLKYKSNRISELAASNFAAIIADMKKEIGE